MKHVVLVADDINEVGLEILREAGMEVVKSAGNPELFAETLPRAHALLVRSATQVTAGVLADAPNLKMIGRAGAGVDNVDVKAATHRGIAVINAPGANTVSAAEHAMAMLLALLRRIPEASNSMASGQWDRKKFSGSEIRGKTLGIAGFGRVGSHVASLARAFGMRVIVYDPFVSEDRANAEKVTLVGLDDVVKAADVLTLHMPLTKETAGLINAARLKQMKKTAVLINTARGGLIDEAALVKAVRSGEIAGAALDVFSEEPLAKGSALRKCDRILVTPHLGASTGEAQERVATEICMSARAALQEGDVHGAVNITGVSANALGRLQPLLGITSKVGKLAAGILGGKVRKLEVSYHGDDDDAPRAVELAAIEGIMRAMDVGPVSLINAAVLAKKMNIEIERRVGKAAGGFDVTVEVSVSTSSKTVSVGGALLGDHQGRIICVDGYDMEFVPEGNVLVLRNADVPGAIGQVGVVLGQSGINVGAYHQARKKGAAEALAVIVVDQEPDSKLLKDLGKLDAVLEARHIEL